MIFKDDSEKLKHEYAQLPAMLQVMCEWFRGLCVAHFKKDPIITRIKEKIDGSSGVHEAGRAVDFRNQHGNDFMFSSEETRFLVSEMNRRFPRTDKKLTMIHHSFNNGPYHFHLQIGIPGVTKDVEVKQTEIV